MASEASRNILFSVGNGPTVGTFQKIVCKTHILELFKLELWDIISRQLLVSIQNMSIFGFFFSPLQNIGGMIIQAIPPPQILGGYIPHPPPRDRHPC